VQKILIIEDNENILSFLKPELQHEGYSVDAASNGAIGLEKFNQSGADLILLDIMPSLLNDLTVLRCIRNASDVPVIILTAQDQPIDKLIDLDCKASDYLIKPFEIQELIARIRYVLQKQKLIPRDILTFKDIKLNIPSKIVTVGDENVILTVKEFDLLVYLMLNVDYPLTRDQILNNAWGYNFYADAKTVDVCIRNLCKKLGNIFSNKNYITTIHGSGLRCC